MTQEKSPQKLSQKIKELETTLGELKAQQNTLKASEKLNRAAVDTAINGFAILDQGKIVSTNARFLEIFGYDPHKKLVGTAFSKLVHPDDRNRINTIYRHKPGPQTEPSRYEFKGLRQDNQALDIEVVSIGIEFQNRPVSMIHLRDITLQKKAEKSLLRNTDQYRLFLNDLLDSSIVGLFIIDADYKVVWLNQTIESFFGLTRKDLIGKDKRQLVSTTSASIFQDAQTVMNRLLASYDANSFPDKFECHVLSAENRQSRWLEHWSQPIRSGLYAGGRIENYVDISDRKQAEQEQQNLQNQLQQAQKMEAIGTLAGGIAHDFNNLMMSIQGNVSLMLFNMDTAHPHFEKLKNIEKQIQSGTQLTSQLLGYARKGKYSPVPFNLNRMITETAATFNRTRRDITVHQELAPNLRAIEADQGQIEQLLLNLYVNAAEAMPEGGDLILRSKNVTHADMQDHLYNPKPGQYIQVMITDTGTGMDQETQDRIFDPFFTTKQMGRGTGLGLASVYGIIKGHGGYIDVASKKGIGTTISFYLPATDKDFQQRSDTIEDIATGKETILFVDDEKTVLAIGAEMLNKIGYTVLTAGSGKEAISIFEEKHADIDLVVLDMVMPGIGGGKVFDQIKKLEPDIKVLLSSGFSINGQATEILNRGCNGFIQKPFSMKELAHKIREIIQSKERDS